jgi:hypothetical protein
VVEGFAVVGSVMKPHLTSIGLLTLTVPVRASNGYVVGVANTLSHTIGRAAARSVVRVRLSARKGNGARHAFFGSVTVSE